MPFRIDQATPGTGNPDEARHDLVAGEVITLVAENTGAGVVNSWELLDKTGSTAVLSAATGDTVTIGIAGLIAQPCSFLIQHTENNNGVVTVTERVASVRTANANLRIPVYPETTPITFSLAANDPDESTDNASYVDRAGLGVTEKNWRGWAEWAYELVLAVEAATGTGGPPSGAAGGDLAGTYPNPTVDGLQGNTVSAASPSPGDILTFSGGQWIPAAPGAAVVDMQDTYDADPAILLTAANPVAVTTSGVGQDGITVTDGTDTVIIRGDCIVGGDCFQPNGGSAPNPAHSFSSDPDTGAYNPAPNQYGISTGGSPALVVDGVLDAATGAEIAYDFTPTINKATSGDYIGINLTATETAAPGSNNLLMRLGTAATPNLTAVTSAGLVQTVAGSEPAPSYAVRDTATGMYSPATNQVSLVANGVSMTLDASGGTTSLSFPNETQETIDLGQPALAFATVHAAEYDVRSSGAQQYVLNSNGIEYATNSTFNIQSQTPSAGDPATFVAIRSGDGGAASGAAGEDGADLDLFGGAGGNGDATFSSGNGGGAFLRGGSSGNDFGGGTGNGGNVGMEVGLTGGGGGVNGSVRIATSNPATDIQSGYATGQVPWTHYGALTVNEGTSPTGTEGLLTAPRAAVGGRQLFSVKYAQDPARGNVVLASEVEAGDSFSGATLSTGDLILLGGQTTASENGPWVVAASGAPSRPHWFAAGGSAAGAAFYVEQGYMAGRILRVINDPATDTIDTHNLNIELETRIHRPSAGGAPTTANDHTAGYFAGDVWLDTTLSPTPRAYINVGYDGGSPTWKLASNFGRQVVSGATSLTITSAMDGDSIRFTANGGNVDITVNTGFTGFVKLIQAGTSTIRVNAGTATREVPAAFDQGSTSAHSAEQYASIELEGRGTTVTIGGYLAAAP